MKRYLILGLALIVLCSGIWHVQATETEEEKPKAQRIQVYADMTRSLEDEVIHLEGSVEIKYMDYIITAEKGKFDRPNDELFMEENVQVLQGENRVNSKNMWMNVATEHIIFTGDVDALFYTAGGSVPLFGQSGEEDGENDQDTGEEEPMQIWSQELEIINETEEIFARENVRAIYQDMDITAQKAHLDQKTDVLTMEDDVFIERDDGSWFSCEKFVYNMEDGTFTATRMRSEFSLPDRSEE